MKFGGSSLPFVAVLDSEGNFLCKHEVKSRTLEAIEATYARGVEVDEALSALRAKAKAGDAKAAVALFEKQLKLAHFVSKDARKRLAGLKGLTSEARAELGKGVDQIEFSELFTSALTANGEFLSVVARYEELVKGGSRPDYGSAGTFWYLYAEKGVKAESPEQVARGLAGLKQIYGWLDEKDPLRARLPEPIRIYTKALAKLRAR